MVRVHPIIIDPDRNPGPFQLILFPHIADLNTVVDPCGTFPERIIVIRIRDVGTFVRGRIPVRRRIIIPATRTLSIRIRGGIHIRIFTSPIFGTIITSGGIETADTIGDKGFA